MTAVRIMGVVNVTPCQCRTVVCGASLPMTGSDGSVTEIGAKPKLEAVAGTDVRPEGPGQELRAQAEGRRP